ncbi:hypothetical protein QTN47_02110 [Danxiaibacter flavus]|uniref:Tetratricopeptide repeat protein n=1 Tax=Danxiaibacter flavus TaxID=3049108 RepID=A0ABV3Z8T1_9BACT|nr:hypothetical protein QNM32_02110 [Chitinophagaceae bacterium DXS]
MKKTALTFLSIGFATVTAFSQKVEDGIKYLYYEKTKSALETLQKVVNDKPKDAYSIYWLGQAMIANEDVAGAKALYQQKLNEGVNDPWLWVGMGNAELLSGGDVNAAKQKFEQAITSTTGTKGKTKGVPNADILNAIGKANADGSSKQGDPQYAVDKLKQAMEIDKTNPEIPVNLGINYLKLGSDKGGEAVEAFREALNRNPNYAKADFRIGRIYQSQNNLDAMNEWYGKAIAADPAYAPVYLNYFRYYQEKDINAAKEYIEKYVANADKDCKTDFFQADYLFRAGKYQESLDKAKQMEAGACKDYAPINLLYAYNYDRLHQPDQARTAITNFFAQQTLTAVPIDAYKIAAEIYKKAPGFEDSAISYLTKAMDIDTVQANKMSYADTIASIYKKTNRPAERYDWLKKSFALNTKPSNADIYNLGDAALGAKDYPVADSMAAIYKTKYPDQPYGYTMLVKSAQAQDSTGTKAVGPINDYIGFLMKDTTKNAQAIAYYHAIQGGYYANTAKNIDSSIAEFEEAVRFDPANVQYKQFLDQLTRVKNKSNQKSSPANKPKQSSGK